MSTISGLLSASDTDLFQSSMSFPEMFSFARAPTRFNFVYIARNVGRASVGGSFGFACARICSGTTELEF